MMAVASSMTEAERPADPRDVAARVVESSHFTLCTGIVDPDMFGSLLIQMEFATRPTVDGICHTLGVKDFSKVMKLISTVVNRIQTSSSAEDGERMFDRFVGDILKNGLQLGHIAKPMEDDYRESHNRQIYFMIVQLIHCHILSPVHLNTGYSP